MTVKAWLMLGSQQGVAFNGKSWVQASSSRLRGLGRVDGRLIHILAQVMRSSLLLFGVDRRRSRVSSGACFDAHNVNGTLDIGNSPFTPALAAR